MAKLIIKKLTNSMPVNQYIDNSNSWTDNPQSAKKYPTESDANAAVSSLSLTDVEIIEE